MAKQSSVQIAVKIDGDGVNARVEPPAGVNATAPSGGPIGITLVAGIALGVFPPAGAKGVLISPGTVGDAVLIAGAIDIDGTQPSFLSLGPTALAGGFTMLSAGGGTLSLVWT